MSNGFNDSRNAEMDVGFYVHLSGHGAFAYYYEAFEILEQWTAFARAKGVPKEKAELTPEESAIIFLLFDLWKELFGYSQFGLPLDWREMDTLLHIRHFDLLLELFFNYKFRGTQPDPID